MDSDSITQLLIIIVLLMLSAFFSSAETALTTSNKVKLKTLADSGDKRAQTCLKVLERYGKMLSAILIGNNIVNLTASALATTFAIKINVTVGIVTAILTIVVLLFCEILPKNITAIKAENLALVYGGIINVLMKIMTPVIILVDFISGGIMKLLRIDTDTKETVTEGELRNYVEVAQKSDAIEEDEEKIIYNLFDFGDSVAKDIMIPRISIEDVRDDCTYDEVLEVFKKCMFTRLPVYSAENDSIVGFLNIKDFIVIESPEDFDMQRYMRKPYFTYEYKKTADLLNEMRSRSESLAFVLNEYGNCTGMVTLEDLLEEIVGEIRDEYDADENDLIQKMEENTYVIEGSMKLDDINDQLELELESEDYDTIGGLVMEYLEDRLPTEGETITTREGITIRVQKVSENRILKVILTIPQ